MDLEQLKRGLTENFDVDDDVKLWRVRAHEAFDPIWKERIMSRTLAYRWLAYHMDLPMKACHIKMMTIEQCQKVIELCEEFRK